jgi:hypothetical protein
MGSWQWTVPAGEKETRPLLLGRTGKDGCQRLGNLNKSGKEEKQQ